MIYIQTCHQENVKLTVQTDHIYECIYFLVTSFIKEVMLSVPFVGLFVWRIKEEKLRASFYETWWAEEETISFWSGSDNYYLYQEG